MHPLSFAKYLFTGALLMALAACAEMPKFAMPELSSVLTWSSGAPAAEPVDDSESSDLRIAASALQSGDLQVARTLYQGFLESHPRHARAWMGLGDTYFLQGEYQRATAAYQKAGELLPEQNDPVLALARIALRTRSLSQAEELYQVVLAREPGQLLALSGLGVSYDLQGKSALAQETYRKGLAIDPQNEALRVNLGLSLALAGQARAAVNTLLGHDGVSDGLPQRRDNLALAYGMLGREDAAEGILQTYQSHGQVQDNLAFYRYLRTRIGVH